MNILKKFCKLPLLIISAVLVVASLVTFIVVNSVEHGNKYEYGFDEFGMSINFKVDFRDDSMLLFSAHIKTAFSNEEVSDVEAMFYTINDGELYVKSDGKTEKAGRLDSYKLTISYPVTDDKSIDVVLKCNTNIALETASIVLMNVFGVLLVASSVYFAIDSKKNKKAVVVNVETVSEPQA